MEFILFIIANWEVISVIFGTLLLWNKDFIMNKLNIRAKKKDIESSTADTIDKNLQLYQKILDDYAQRKEAEDKEQKARISVLEERLMTLQAQKELDNNITSAKIADLEQNVLEIREENFVLRKEKEDKAWEVHQLREEISEIKAMLNKALRQLEFYKQNSDLDLPEELQ